MAAVINTNVSSLQAQQSLNVNQRSMQDAMRQLSTGSRVSSAKDDAAGLAIGMSMTSQIRGLNQAVRNLNDGMNMLQTAEGSLSQSNDMLQRMRELAVQSANGALSGTQRGYLQTEFGALAGQISKISSDTTWNGTAVLNTGASYTFQAGMGSTNTIVVAFGSGLSATALGVDAATLTIGTAGTASGALATLDTAITAVATQRATLGAAINQMTYASDNLTNVSTNISASRSSIMDTDYASASSQLSKGQIIQQAATAMLAQANQQPQTVLALLK